MFIDLLMGKSPQQRADYDYLKQMHTYAMDAYGHRTESHDQNNKIRRDLGLAEVADMNTYTPPEAPTLGSVAPAPAASPESLGGVSSVIAKKFLRLSGTNTVLSGG